MKDIFQTAAAPSNPVVAYTDGKIIRAADFENNSTVFEISLRHQAPTHFPILLRFSPNSRQLLSAGSDGVAYLWDLAAYAESNALGPTERPLALIAHASRITAVAFSTSGRYIATGSGDGTIMVWDASGGGRAIRRLLEIRVHEHEITSLLFFTRPDGSLWLASVSPDRVWTARWAELLEIVP